MTFTLLDSYFSVRLHVRFSVPCSVFEVRELQNYEASTEREHEPRTEKLEG